MKENQDSYQIASLLPNGFEEIWKVINRIPESELKNYKKLGEGAGPIEVALSMAFKYCPNFYDLVVGYTVSEEGVGKMIQKVMEKELPNHPQVKAGGFTYTFYGTYSICYKVGDEIFFVKQNY